MIDVKTSLLRSDAYMSGIASKHPIAPVLGGFASFLTALASVGATIGNYTSTVTAVDISAGSAGILTAYGMLVDMMIYMGNEFFLKSALGQIYVAMACVLFTFILVKSLLRHSSGGRKR